jgi:hypothetical protein
MLTEYCSVDQIENELGWAFNTNGREERRVQGFDGVLRGKDHFVDLGLDGRIILIRIFRKWVVGIWTGSSWLSIETGGGHL